MRDNNKLSFNSRLINDTFIKNIVLVKQVYKPIYIEIHLKSQKFYSKRLKN